LASNKKDDPVVRVLAKRIIEKAREGIHDAALLKAAALDGLGATRQH
jgi:hypothetical protein